MAIVAWSTMYDYILPDVMGVTSAVVDAELRKVCIDFFEQAHVMSEEVTPIDVVAATAEYTLTPVTTETAVVVVKAAWYDDAPLDLAPLDILSSKNPQWQDDTSSSPTAYTQRRPDKIILYPSPTESLADGLRVEIVLKPTLSSTGIEQWVRDRYVAALADGAKGRLMAQPGKPWTNLELSSYHTNLYEAAKTRATIDVNRSFTRAALSVRMRPAA